MLVLLSRQFESSHSTNNTRNNRRYLTAKAGDDSAAAEAVYLLTGEYEANVRVYDEIELQALGMVDVMAEGIIRQFHFILNDHKGTSD